MGSISVEKLNFKYDKKQILNDITFKIKIPSLISIVGPNNSGKTTLIRCLCGSVPTEDVITIDDTILSKKTVRKYSRSIGVVFSDDYNQFLFSKVFDEISFPLCNLNYSKKKIKDQIKYISKMLFIDDILDKNTDSLTNLERVKVLIATSIIHHPKVLLLDDILNNLNSEEKENILLLLKRVVRELEIIIIMTTSNLEDAIYSDALIVIDEGTIRYSGRLSDILEHDNALTKIGIEIPVMMDMSLKLKFYNLLDHVILNEEEMVDTLWD
jgi:energy-coupling factor transporter ATP-binding protein EcfA2